MLKIVDKIRIINMEGEPQYSGKEGIVTSINKDPWNETQIHGTWGGCCLYLEHDSYEVIENDKLEH